MQLAPVDKPRLQALPYRSAKKSLEHLLAPPPARLREHAVVGNLIFQSVTKEPQVIDPQRDDPHQLPLAGHVVPKEQQHHLHDDDRIDAHVPVVPVKAPQLIPHEIQLQHPFEFSQRMVFRYPPRKIYRFHPQLILLRVFSHHSCTQFYSFRPFNSRIWATARCRLTPSSPSSQDPRFPRSSSSKFLMTPSSSPKPALHVKGPRIHMAIHWTHCDILS